MRSFKILLLFGFLAPGLADAMDCPAASAAQPLRPALLAPVASELTLLGNPLGSSNGVLSQSADESQSVDQVLLRIHIESCQNVATVTPASTGVVSPDNPAAYKPRTQFDNTPWRFNMSQNGKNMTADEFSAWMKSRGVRVARGANVTPAPVLTPTSAPIPSPDIPAQDETLPAMPIMAPLSQPPQSPPIESPPHP